MRHMRERRGIEVRNASFEMPFPVRCSVRFCSDCEFIGLSSFSLFAQRVGNYESGDAVHKIPLLLY